MMDRRVPAGGVVAWMGLLAAWLANPPNAAHAQLGFFGSDSDDGGSGDAGDAGPYPFLRPRKLVSNPWKADAGPQGDAASGIESAFAPFRRGSYVKDRAPAISALTDEDGGLLSSSGGDAGGGPSFDFNVELPSFGADIDAGPRDAGPVVAPDLRIARPRDFATPLTSGSVPEGTRWARLPDTVQPLLWSTVQQNPTASYSALTRAQRDQLWKTVDADARYRTHWGFILGEGGAPVPARLSAVGMRAEGPGRAGFYGAWAHPRSERAAVGGVLVFAGSRNMGPWRKPRPLRTPVNANFHRAVGAVARATEAPVGIRGPLAAGQVDSAVIHTREGTVVEVMIHESRPPAGRPALCMDLLLSADGHILRRGTWSPLCDPAPVTATDADGDGVDEVLWRVGSRLSLRTYPQGTLLDEDPPANAADTPPGGH